MTDRTFKNGAMSNGHVSKSGSISRAKDLDILLKSILDQLIPFVAAADEEVSSHKSKINLSKSVLLDERSPSELLSLLHNDLELSIHPRGQSGILSILESILKYSVNTLAPGFMDKLYAGPLPPGIAADLILSVLNTNLHVYHVSPVLTLIEKQVTKSLAQLFGFNGPRSGGINVQGGSASNMTSIVIARNTLFPQTKIHGNSHDGLQLVMFTSAHGHYSIEKAAQQCGFGSAAVISVPVDPITGAMIADEFERLVIESKKQGKTPFYVNATAGSTVLGSFDPFVEISAIAKRHDMWLHIDGAWGGTFIFSETLRKERLKGCELADSIAINPHKMMGVPITCSFLLGKDMKQFHDANTLRAGYLFHDEENTENHEINGNGFTKDETDANQWTEPNDLADMTLQCGRRGDSLKLFMSWQYYGSNGYQERIEKGYQVANHLAFLVSKNQDLKLVSQYPLPCLQVCFYYAPGGNLLYDTTTEQIQPSNSHKNSADALVLGKYNSQITEKITKTLVSKGFMIDFAPALENQESYGKFFRVVVNIQTPVETVERLLDEILTIGETLVKRIQIERNKRN